MRKIDHPKYGNLRSKVAYLSEKFEVRGNRNGDVAACTVNTLMQPNKGNREWRAQCVLLAGVEVAATAVYDTSFVFSFHMVLLPFLARYTHTVCIPLPLAFCYFTITIFSHMMLLASISHFPSL
jgi:hypothetical protein